MNALGARREHAKNKLDESGKESNKVSQGHAGDCFFLAPLISLQKTKPDAVKNMINQNENGTSTVTFPGGNGKIEVDKPTESEKAMFGGNETAATLEKALRKSELTGMEIDKNANTSLEVGQIDGGLIKSAMHLLTGKENKTFYFKDKNIGPIVKDSDLQSALETAARENTPMAAGYYGATQNGLVNKHAYAVSYDEKSGKVPLENPIKPVGDAIITKSFPTEPALANGRPKDGVNDSRFTMTVAEFKQRFHELSIAGK